MTRTLFFVLMLLVLSGCVRQPLAPPPSTATAPKASLLISPRFVGSYRSQALVSAYAAADVHHLLLRLFTLNGQTEDPALGPNNTPIELDLMRAELGSPISIGNLKAGTTYRVKAFAYKAPGTADSDLISTTDGSSYRDVAITENDQMAVALGVKLIDKAFSAAAKVTLSATGSINFASVLVTLSANRSGNNSVVSTASLQPDQLPNLLIFDNLNANTTYTLLAQAMTAEGQAVSGASNQTSIEVATDTVVATSSLLLTVPY